LGGNTVQQTFGTMPEATDELADMDSSVWTEAAQTAPQDGEEMKPANIDTLIQSTDLWVFGYGSILWNTGFEYKSRQIGFVNGYSRRFWQGNTTHRGTPNLPGRVATLVQQPDGRVWGASYHLTGKSMIRNGLEHLGLRECTLGGYNCYLLSFTARCNQSSSGRESHQTLAFIANPTNSLFLGPTTLDDLATHVVACHGASGSNVDYVVKLAEFIRDQIPEDEDEHLFQLECKVKELLRYSTSECRLDNLVTQSVDRINRNVSTDSLSSSESIEDVQEINPVGYIKDNYLDQSEIISIDEIHSERSSLEQSNISISTDLSNNSNDKSIKIQEKSIEPQRMNRNG